ncbi:MAG TPA: cytochrome c oxidase subunit II [Actinomycetota bacterium]|nr:cytochrome c oxidase subunit II [Actinomycetota bacterium]
MTSCAPAAVTREGREVNELYDIFFWVAAGVFAVTAGLIGWSLIRYRAKPGDNELPEQFHQNLALEITWFAIPQVIVIVLFVLSAITLGQVNEEEPEADAIVHVTGFQWGWRFEYEGTEAEVVGTPEDPAEVMVPTGDVTFLLTSSDVVHNFYVPKFLLKRDLTPGRETRIDVDIEETGRYPGVCAEFCGLLHHQMTFTIEAVSPDEFESWLVEQEGGVDGDG